MANNLIMEKFALTKAVPIGLFIISIFIGLTSFGGLLNLVFPVAATAIAVLLYVNKPLAYLSFTIWIWMLTPLIRRMSDFQGEYHSVSILLIAPLAVSVVSAVSLIRYRGKLDGRALLPFIIVLIILAYGFFVGALKGGLTTAALALANWGVPVIFAMHILVLPADALDKAKVMLRALVFGGLVIGAYGIIQFVALPPWDSNWMRQSGLTSIGQPFSFDVRVFSTLNSPGPFAQYIAAASLASFTTQSSLRLPSMLLAIVSLLLTLVRAVWGSWLVSFLLLFYWAPRRYKTNYVVVALAVSLIVTPLLVITPLGTTISDRIVNLSNFSDDASYTERRNLYLNFTKTALTSVTGVGLGQTGVIAGRLAADQYVSEVTTIDSGILEVFYSLGLMGAIFLGAIAILVMRSWPRVAEPFTTATFIVAFVNLPVMLFGNSIIAAGGMLFYPFLAAAIAVKKDASSRNSIVETPVTMEPADARA